MTKGDEAQPFAEAPTGEMRARAAKGMAFTGISQASRLVLQTLSTIVVARLLSPADYGLYAMASPVVAFVALFQSLGISQAVIQKPKITHQEVSALYWISFFMSAGLAVLLALIAPLVAGFYGQHELVALTTMMGLNLVIAGAGAVHGSLLARQLRFGAMSILDIAAAIVGLAVSVSMAYLLKSYWAIYLGNLSVIVTTVAGNWILTKWRPGWPKKLTGAGTALKFGANVTGFNVANFFARNLDNVLIGWRWGDSALGLYDRAYKLFLFPLQQVNQPVGRVMLPILSRLAAEPERYTRAIQKAMSYILLLTVPGVVFLITTADVLIPFLLGDKWRGAVPIFAALGWAALIQTMNTPAGWMLMSQGRGGDFLRLGITNTVFTVIAFWIGLPYGPVGVAIAYAVVEYVRAPAIWLFVTRTGPVSLRAILAAVTPVYIAGAVALGALFALRRLEFGPPLFILATSVIASYGVVAATLFLLPGGRRLLNAVWSDARPMLTNLVARVSRS